MVCENVILKSFIGLIRLGRGINGRVALKGYIDSISLDT